MSIGHPCDFFREVPIQAHCSFFNWVVYSFDVEFSKFLNTFWILTPYRVYWQICPPILWVVFLFYRYFPLLCKNFLIWCSLICSFFFLFVSPAWGVISDKILLRAMSEILLPMFSSRIFMVLGLKFKSLIHFEFFSCVWCKKVVLFHFYACICPIFPIPFIE